MLPSPGRGDVQFKGLLRAAPLGAHDPRLLLRPPDVQHAFVGIEALQILARDVVLALVFAETHQRQPGVGHETLDVVGF